MAADAASLSPAARAFHDEYWDWLWHGEPDGLTIGEKKAELRQKHGAEAEAELLSWLRSNGFIQSGTPE